MGLAKIALELFKAIFVPEIRAALRRRREREKREQERREREAYRKKLEAFWDGHFARVERMKARNRARWEEERPTPVPVDDNPYGTVVGHGV